VYLILQDREDYFITNVNPTSSAFGVLHVGDRIARVDGQLVQDMSHEQLKDYLGQRRPSIELAASRLQLQDLLNTGSPTEGPLLEVELVKKGASVGFTLTGASNDEYGGLFCLASFHKELEPGDRLLAINDIGCLTLSREQALLVLKALPQGPFRLLVMQLGAAQWSSLQQEADLPQANASSASSEGSNPLSSSIGSQSSVFSSDEMDGEEQPTRVRRVSFSVSCGRGLRRLVLPCPSQDIRHTTGRLVAIDVNQNSSKGLGFSTATFQGAGILCVFVETVRPSSKDSLSEVLQVGDRLLELHGKCVSLLSPPELTALLRRTDSHAKLVVQRLGSSQWKVVETALRQASPVDKRARSTDLPLQQHPVTMV